VTPKLSEAGDLQNKLCVVTSFDMNTGSAYVVFKDFMGVALITFKEISKAGWCELSFGNFLVADVVSNDGKPRGVNVREATAEDFE